MSQPRRKHVRKRSAWALELLVYGVVGLGAGIGLAVALGVSWWQAGLAAAGLALVLVIAVVLERSGLLRLSRLDEDK
ncbi:MAG: hypothetical protein M3353_04025 [Actinomycetota bacterium]|nr:hypothetical protein [Actinomycetota bacterium]